MSIIVLFIKVKNEENIDLIDTYFVFFFNLVNFSFYSNFIFTAKLIRT